MAPTRCVITTKNSRFSFCDFIVYIVNTLAPKNIVYAIVVIPNINKLVKHIENTTDHIHAKT